MSCCSFWLALYEKGVLTDRLCILRLHVDFWSKGPFVKYAHGIHESLCLHFLLEQLHGTGYLIMWSLSRETMVKRSRAVGDLSVVAVAWLSVYDGLPIALEPPRSLAPEPLSSLVEESPSSHHALHEPPRSTRLADLATFVYILTTTWIGIVFSCTYIVNVNLHLNDLGLWNGVYLVCCQIHRLFYGLWLRRIEHSRKQSVSMSSYSGDLGTVQLQILKDGQTTILEISDQLDTRGLLSLFPGCKVTVNSRLVLPSSSLAAVCSGQTLKITSRTLGGASSDARGWHDNQREAAEARIPSWAGDPTSFPRFETAVKWWLEGEDLSFYEKTGVSLAARFLRKQHGVARTKAEEFTPEEL